MEKKKLLVLMSISIMFVYGIGLVNKSSATDSTSVPEQTISPPAPYTGCPWGICPPRTGLTVQMLNSTVIQPSLGQLVEIHNGTFTQDPANPVCPVSPGCGTPNTSLVGSASCPTICYVKTNNTGLAPNAQPFNYPVCPQGYATITTGAFDLYYKYYPPTTIYPSSVSELDGYQNTGYSCNPNIAFGTYICPSGYVSGQYYPIMGLLYTVTFTDCHGTGPGVCWGGVSCGVAHYTGTTIAPMMCTRAAGYYPVPIQTEIYSSNYTVNYYQMAPQEVICGLIATQWIQG